MPESVAQAEGEVVTLTGVRRAAARQMIAAWEAPAFHLAIDVDMGTASTVKTRVAGATVTDALLAAVAGALRAVPALNAWYEGDFTVRRFDAVNLGLAVATPGGLTVPIVHDAANLTLAELGEKRRDIVTRAREGKLRRDDITGGTFTVSNLGMLGIRSFDAILNVPQVAILAVGATRDAYVDSPVGMRFRQVATMTLTCDHRAVDGAEGAQFLNELRTRLEAPADGN